MHYHIALFLICLYISVIDLTVAQSTHVIKVGDTGSFYDPQVTSARTGDIVSFQWTGRFHSVTQSSFDNPCTPLPGGFDSGVTGNPQIQQLIIPAWNLTITDDTQPIWFFCKVTAPVSHCANGMVGAINADLTNGNHSFNNFSQNAKLLQNPPTLSDSPPVLTGVGAAAMTTPLPIRNISGSSVIPTTITSSATSTISSSSSLSTSSAIQPQQNASSPGLSTGLIGGIAGAAAGFSILVILLALLFMSFRRGKRYRREAKEIQQLHSKSDMSHVDRFNLDGILPEPALTPSQQLIRLHRSQGSLSVNESVERESTTSPSIAIRELAAEIAKNMRQEINQPDRGGLPLDATALSTVSEQVIEGAISRGGSSRVTELSGRGRQLPVPPQTQTRADVRSVDTLPAYAPGHAR